MDTKQLQPMLDELETDVERLKALYQQYFMGLEKLPPAVLRKKVDRAFWHLRRERLPTTGTRFKFQQILQRYNTYEQYWARTLRQIENGTFKRDVIRAAKLVGKEHARSALGKAAAGLDVDRAVPSDAGRGRAWDVDEANGDWDDDAKTPPNMRLSDLGVAPGHLEQGPPPTVRNPAAISYPGLRSHAAPPSAPQAGPFPFGFPRPQAPPAQPSAPTAHAAWPAATPHPGHAQAGAPHASPYAGIPAPTARPLLSPQELAAQMRARAAGGGRAWPTPPTSYGTPQGLPHGAVQPAASEDSRSRAIYQEYVAARRRSGESVEGLTYERVAKSLSEQGDKLRAQHPNRTLDFEVVQKDGKAVIKPVVK